MKADGTPPNVFASATKVFDAFQTESVDTLPPEPEDMTIESLLESGDYTILSQFLAYVKQSRIATSGEFTITLGVAPEFKYNAMPMTDIRGVQLVITVHRPMRREEVEYRANGESQESQESQEAQ